ncbi:MAG: DUF1611 domain-containing protein [Cyanobacteria bacterium SZAS LIN-3]|nr:DUF1611 domain-containing protein [Cyanobacteria bacterium SZAS LIN-3]
MYLPKTARLAIYVQDEFGKGSSKSAEGVLRYAPNPIACCIDSRTAGKSISAVVGIDSPAPIVASIEEALTHKPDALLLGTAWSGGKLPTAWREDIIKAVKGRLHVVNGLHDFLSDDEEIAALAREHGVKLFDVRRPPDNLPVGNGRVLKTDALVVLTVGSDCSVGKMTTTLEIQKSATKKGVKSEFVATGQTGIMIAGRGIAIDRVIGDFMAGATEQMVLEASKEAELVLVEGQGSISHPGFSGVTLALLHGSAPQALILCHRPARKCLKSTEFPVAELPRLIQSYESVASYLRPARVIAIALNTQDLDQEEALRAVEETTKATGLPATDPVRFGADVLFDTIRPLLKKDQLTATRE